MNKDTKKQCGNRGLVFPLAKPHKYEVLYPTHCEVGGEVIRDLGKTRAMNAVPREPNFTSHFILF